ncbi:hypothetical protein E4U41_007808, partial [Claviceps citrina]
MLLKTVLARARAAAQYTGRGGTVTVPRRRGRLVAQCALHQQQHRRHGGTSSSSKKEALEPLTWLTCRPPGAREVDVGYTDKHMVVLTRRVGEPSDVVVRPAALRDSCACRACRDVSSGQKTFGSVEVPPDIGFADVRPTEQGLAIRFTNEIARFARADGGHETILPWEHFASRQQRQQQDDSLAGRKRAVLARTGVQYWDADTLATQVRRLDYRAFMQPDSAIFWDAVVDLLRLGIVFLANVPRDEASVVAVTTRIANIRETLYGRTFDVRAKPHADNVAYTAQRLGLHQDLCYLRPPPMIQVLHCMDNACPGGESLFSDGARAAALLGPFVDASERMAPLATHRIPYQYDKNGFFYRAQRPASPTSPT